MESAWGNAPKKKTSFDCHALVDGVVAIGYDEGTLEWRAGHSSPLSRVGTTGGIKVEGIRWAPRLDFVLACYFGEHATVFEQRGTVWKSQTLRGHSMDILSISWSSDGTRLATSSVDNRIIIWDVAHVRQLHVINATGWVKSCSLDPAFRYVAGCVEENVVVWRIADGVEYFRESLAQKTGGMATSVDYSPDGKFLCAASSDGCVLLVERQNEASAISLEGFTEAISRVRFFPGLFRTSSKVHGLVCICSSSRVVVFSSADPISLGVWNIKGCDDVSWTSEGQLQICSHNQIETLSWQLPSETSRLSHAELMNLIQDLYKNPVIKASSHSSSTLGSSLNANGVDLVDNVSQMELEEKFKSKQTLNAGSKSLRAPNNVSALQNGSASPSKRLKESPHKLAPAEGGKPSKKRIQPQSLSAAPVPKDDQKVRSLPDQSTSGNIESNASSQGFGEAKPAHSSASSGEGVSLNATITTTTTPSVSSGLSTTGVSTSVAELPAPPPPPGRSSSTISLGQQTSAATTKPTGSNSQDVDCGTCKYCLDKPKFGGKNLFKHRCLNRPPVVKRSSKTNLPIDQEDEADEEEDDDEDEYLLSSDEGEADSDNENSAMILTPLRLSSLMSRPEIASTASPAGKSPVFSCLIGPNRLLNAEWETQKERTILTCFDKNRSERQWTCLLRGHLEGLCHSNHFLAIVTNTDELSVFHVISGVIATSPVVLSSACAFLHFFTPSKLGWCTRNGRFSLFDLDSNLLQLHEISLSPLLNLRGKPFTLSSETFSSKGSRNVILELVGNDIPVLLVVNKKDGSACAFAYENTKIVWTKVLDPKRFLGSEFCEIFPANRQATDGQVSRLEKRLIQGMATVVTASQAVHLVGTTPVSIHTTVCHVESLIHACWLLGSDAEVKSWLYVLFDKFSRDFGGFHRKAKFWLFYLDRQSHSLKKYVREDLLMKLASNRDYQGLVESFLEHDADVVMTEK